jgi:low affinity Fe/Cu permease
MNTAFDVFINGIAGVFTGIAVLYVMMKILAITAGRPPSVPPD